tara:strand:- start:148865 stop:150178 length:1314 start_codon:yes stop_codon:yes gene_type:complete
MTFKDLGLIDPILRALEAQGYTTPTPIQAQSIPILLNKKDLLGCAQTGTGKTAAFSIPIIQHLYNSENNKGQKKIKALIVTPTRELALQIGESFSAYSKNTSLKNTVIFGGVKQGAQTQALNRGVDILVATPGRLLDLMSQGYINLKDIEYFVLDEADQMLDMGFIHDIKKVIAKLPVKRQSLFFSATMAKSIVELSQKILGNPERVTIKPEQATAERVEQALYYVPKGDKVKLLAHLVEANNMASTLVFSRTKHGANKVVKMLEGFNITAEAIHGNKTQNARQKALKNFKDGSTKVLIATDIAARGIDVDGLSLVVNYDLPNVPETYVHRIGRTGRAQASGVAISFCDHEEKTYLRDIEKLIKQEIPVVDQHPFFSQSVLDAPAIAPKKPQRQGRSPRQDGGGNRGGGSSSRNKPSSRNSSGSGSASRKPRPRRPE